MDEIELRRKLSDRTFEAGLKLMDKGAIQEIVKLSDSAITLGSRMQVRRSSCSETVRVISTPHATARRRIWVASIAPRCT